MKSSNNFYSMAFNTFLQDLSYFLIINGIEFKNLSKANVCSVECFEKFIGFSLSDNKDVSSSSIYDVYRKNYRKD